jgi:hypothetical protein
MHPTCDWTVWQPGTDGSESGKRMHLGIPGCGSIRSVRFLRDSACTDEHVLAPSLTVGALFEPELDLKRHLPGKETRLRSDQARSMLSRLRRFAESIRLGREGGSSSNSPSSQSRASLRAYNVETLFQLKIRLAGWGS